MNILGITVTSRHVIIQTRRYSPLRGLREHLIKKMQLNYGLLPKRSYPPPPPDFWNFWDTLSYADFFSGTFGALFVSYFTKIRVKSVQKLLDLVNPPPFSAQNSKIVGAQKVSQNFWIASEPPPPLLEEVHN